MNPNCGATGDTDAGDQNDKQSSGDATSGADEKVDASLIQAHAEQYGADGGPKRGY
ncbi:hypothetical protein SBA1_50005 [Candidatus Sulfotelmatobacter kueseliae]|uniref:Uncharacterized protein n=1 Tax=Candidatus Sulfotelmatobacter kueseliae TaxID=2042962 RepID=A0A2U3KV44_9BACT|nr:hypothetical protein SBA1_50005 [Candidatus Sulfotelmatobacter kueseliae]